MYRVTLHLLLHGLPVDTPPSIIGTIIAMLISPNWIRLPSRVTSSHTQAAHSRNLSLRRASPATLLEAPDHNNTPATHPPTHPPSMDAPHTLSIDVLVCRCSLAPESSSSSTNDFVTTIDATLFNPDGSDNPNFGSIVTTTDSPYSGTEPHHCSVNKNGKVCTGWVARACGYDRTRAIKPDEPFPLV